MPGAPKVRKYSTFLNGLRHGPPTAWKGYEPKIDLGAPVVAAVDNPGSWNLFLFDAKYGTEKGKLRKYLGHFTPALAKGVPPDETGNREVQRWKFHYNGWNPDEFNRQTYARGDASAINLKPESRRGSLDVNVLKKHGCKLDISSILQMNI
jgi:hypothetical protein